MNPPVSKPRSVTLNVESSRSPSRTCNLVEESSRSVLSAPTWNENSLVVAYQVLVENVDTARMIALEPENGLLCNASDWDRVDVRESLSTDLDQTFVALNCSHSSVSAHAWAFSMLIRQQSTLNTTPFTPLLTLTCKNCILSAELGVG
jgi:hypothetical protein